MRVNALVLLVFSTGCALMPDHSQDHKKSQDRLDMAKEYLRKHELEAAENECNKALAFNHDNDEAYVVRGLVAMVRTVDTQRPMETDPGLAGTDRAATGKTPHTA